MKLARAEQMRELDRAAIQDRGIPSLELMERAAGAAARAALALAEERGAAATTAATAWPPPASSGRWAWRCAVSWRAAGRS